MSTTISFSEPDGEKKVTAVYFPHGSSLSTLLIVVYHCAKVVGHVGVVLLQSQWVLYSALSVMFRNDWILTQIREMN